MTRTFRLLDLAASPPLQHRCGPPDPLYVSATSDSRRVEPGWAYVAVRGNAADGHDFTAAAVERGARVLVLEPGRAADRGWPDEVSVFESPRPRSVLGHLVREVHGAPDRDLTLVAVTGTNGKTTVSHVVRDLMRAMGQPCGLLGTIRYETGARSVPAPLTTPGVEDFYALLDEMRSAGCIACAFEASSHALDQDRLGPAAVDVGVFLNLTREHLDYHVTMESYLQAKLRLLERLQEESAGRAVVNRDDPVLAGVAWPRGTVFVGAGEESAVRLRDARYDRAGTTLDVEIEGRRLSLRSRLLGAYNASNLLAALGVTVALGWDLAALPGAVAQVAPVPGRLEPVELPDGPACLVDYAHTPDGIAITLAACRDLTAGRIFLVFGCGGDRDRGKRPLMMRTALDGADFVVLTLDNPRTEDPEQIFRDAEMGAADHPNAARLRRVVDRAEAIATALREAHADDLVLIVGKGHENYQILGDRKIAWDDRLAARSGWERVRGVRG